ncbi:MAG: orotidine-5'-phosphate decarboxylase [Gemmatimonadetes bacterium]|nr:orotidine-5'-phosphate decarboxylase [Gemmatimonadota bacterium]
MAKVILALDTASATEAIRLVEALGEAADFYKVGLELYTRAGPSVVSELRARGKRVFLDLKLHDIPNTVVGAVAAASDLSIDLLTLHAAGGRAMLEAARGARTGPMRLVGVTVLTSLASEDLRAAWGRDIDSVSAEVDRLADLAQASGLDGVVASAEEAAALRARHGAGFLLVVPGIRPAGTDRGDQKRVATPAAAVRAGADYLVVGRAVTSASDPSAALATVLSEVAGAEAETPGTRG